MTQKRSQKNKKSRIQKGKKQKPNQSQPQRRSNSKVGLLSRYIFLRSYGLSFWKIFLAIATMLGFMATALTLSARLSVSSITDLNPAQPFSAMFTISNDGYVSVQSVQFICSAKQVKYPNDNFVSHYMGNNDSLNVGSISPGEKATVPCTYKIGSEMPILSGD